MGFVRRRRVWRRVTFMHATAFIAVLMLALALTVLFAPLTTGTQPAGKVPRIGMIGDDSATASYLTGFRQGLSHG